MTTLRMNYHLSEGSIMLLLLLLKNLGLTRFSHGGRDLSKSR